MSLQRNLRYKLLLFLVFFTIIHTSFSQNISADFYPEKDNTMFSESNTTSDGSGKNIFAGKTEGNLATEFRRALVKFNITGIPANATILSAKLTLSVVKASSTAINHNVAIYKVVKDWGEGASVGLGKGGVAKTNDATWKYAFYSTQSWAKLGGDFVASASATTSVHYNVSTLQYAVWSSTAMLNDVNAWIANPTTNFGWILIGDESVDGSAKRFSSREETIFPKPTLTLVYSLPVEENLYINELSTAQKWVELYNPSKPTIDLSNYWLVNGTNSTSLANVSPLNGDLQLDSAEYIILPVPSITANSGELALYKGNPTSTSSIMKSYLQYGTANNAHVTNAVSAAVWDNIGNYLVSFSDSTKSYSVNSSTVFNSGKTISSGSWLTQKKTPAFKNTPCPTALNLKGNLLNGSYQSSGLHTLSNGSNPLYRLELNSSKAVELQAPQELRTNAGQLTLSIADCTY